MADKTDEPGNDLLGLLKDEKANSIGFDEDAQLSRARELSLDYYKGVMTDVPALEGRSRAISTDIADAVETILPDLVEIFTAEDVAAFMPRGQEDEDAAEQETDYINHVFFNENDGFMILYTAIKDALLSKTGIFKWYSEEYDESESFEGKSEEEAVAALEANPDSIEDAKSGDDGTWSFTIKRKGKKTCVSAVAPEDFTVSRDTTSLRTTPYCAHRARRRVFELIEDGLPADKVRQCESYGGANFGAVARARDTAGEDDQTPSGSGDRRVVEVIEHYIRRKGKYTRVLTDGPVSMILEQEDIPTIRFSAITPYPTTHRFYGESVADRLLEIQRIRTTLTRMILDSGYFALNGRSQINMNLINEWTIPDLLNNAPNMPVRTNGDAITPLVTSPLGFDPFAAQEYFQTQSEQRTGIVRNAQGLNPDTLHDTAKGALALMTAAQKRIRLIARILAETGVKDMFVGLHALIRETSSGEQMVRLRNKWVPVDPTSWGSRKDMTIEIGVGASGQEAEMLKLQQALQLQEAIVAQQGGAQGPLVTAENVYNMTKRFLEKGLRIKNADAYISDPAEAEPQEPQPDPKLVEVQSKAELAKMDLEGRQALAQADMQGKMMLAEVDIQAKQADMAARLQMDTQKAAAKASLDAESAALDAQLKRDEAAASIQAKRDQVAGELALKREQIAAELELKREQIALDAELRREGMRVDAEVSVATADVETGGAGG